jgi:hypothetical protein
MLRMVNPIAAGGGSAQPVSRVIRRFSEDIANSLVVMTRFYFFGCGHTPTRLALAEAAVEAASRPASRVACLPIRYAGEKKPDATTSKAKLKRFRPYNVSL